MSQDVVAAASAALGRELRDLGGLGGSDRSGVHRAADGDGTVVVKSYAGGSLGSWARERVGLSVAGSVGVAPRLLATAADPPLVVMEDLGTASDVAQHLLGSDPLAADDALLAWARSLGTLHARTHADRAAIATAFAEAEGAVLDEPVDRFHAGVAGSTDQATRDWATDAEALGIDGPPDVDALAAVLADTEHHALSPADVCPDNNLLLPDGCRLIDFEWAEVRHPAWDAAYLAVPWPTCWCSWRIPTAVADGAVARYRERVAPTVPYVASEAFGTDLDLATLGWCLMTASWSVHSALEEDEVPLEGPSTRPRMLHRLWLAAHQSGPPPLTSYARDLYRVLARRWGEPTLVLAPAFRDEDIAIP